MSIEHTRVKSGEGWYLVAGRLCPPGTLQAKRNVFAEVLARTNGLKLASPIYTGQVLHYDTADIPILPVTPPATRPATTVPFAPSSPWNTPIADQSRWVDVPILRNFTDAGVEVQRNWFAGEGQLSIWKGTATDPLWTFTLPEFGNDDTRFNRHWMPATFKMRAPQNMQQAVNDADHILALIDETTGEYVECWSGVNIDSVAHTVVGPPGAGWARGNIDTGSGVGGLLSAGGNSAGVRAANFSWIAGAITGYDVKQVLDGTKTDFGHALVVMLTAETLSTWGVTPPATAPNNGWNNGPIKMGSRIGVPANVARPAKITDKLGIAYFNTLQKYGAFVGDYCGGPWPIFQVDINSVPSGTLNPMWVWWNDVGIPTDATDGKPQTAGRYIVPHLRVMEG